MEVGEVSAELSNGVSLLELPKKPRAVTGLMGIKVMIED